MFSCLGLFAFDGAKFGLAPNLAPNPLSIGFWHHVGTMRSCRKLCHERVVVRRLDTTKPPRVHTLGGCLGLRVYQVDMMKSSMCRLVRCWSTLLLSDQWHQKKRIAKFLARTKKHPPASVPMVYPSPVTIGGHLRHSLCRRLDRRFVRDRRRSATVAQ